MKSKRKCEVTITDDAKNDFIQLPKDVIPECLSLLKRLEFDIELGKKLYDKNGKDLSKCRKLYFGQAAFRIVYKELSNDTVEIAEIVAMGERENQAVYEIAFDRLNR